MPAGRDPLKAFVYACILSPGLFALGLYLYFLDRDLGEPYKVEGQGVIGLATNLSLVGLTAVVRFFISFGPQLLLMVAIALPVLGAIYAVERATSRRARITPRRRGIMWVVACAEAMALLALFMQVIDPMHA